MRWKRVYRQALINVVGLWLFQTAEKDTCLH